MKYRILGLSDLRVSEIGFGTWGIGGLTKGATSYGQTSDEQSLKTLHQALELGINFFDTSNIYGNGHSEELLAEAFSGNRNRVIIATKVGFSRHNGPQDFSTKNIRISLEGSLRRLKSDYVDLYQLHDPSMEILHNEGHRIISDLKKLKQEGKIRAYGISLRFPNDGVEIIERFDFQSIQTNFSIIDQRIIINGLLRSIEKYNIGLIARTPLCFGFLSGKYKNYQFDKRDHRSTWPKKQIEKWIEAPNFFNKIKKDKSITSAQLALNYCLSYSALSTAIPGMLEKEHVQENSVASRITQMSNKELEIIEAVYKANIFFDPNLGK